MRKNLLLYLSSLDYPGNIPIASTLAWLSQSCGYAFDSYYDSYHQGIHFPGGDYRDLELGQLTGSTVSGGRHFSELYYILLNYDVLAVSLDENMFLPTLRRFDIPVVPLSGQINVFYRNIFAFFETLIPSEIVLVGSGFGKTLTGLEAYFYPEIFYRKALGVPDTISEDELDDLCRDSRKILCLCVDAPLIRLLEEKGYQIEVIDQLENDADYYDVTKRIACRWREKAKGWILGDPVLVYHWLPKACDKDLIAIYSIPQEKVISELADLISSEGKVIYGRQYNDRDFFELSKLDQCLQVIDPCRPPFQSVEHLNFSWPMEQRREGFFDHEYTDEELKRFASEGRILVSLMFWTGMIREVENLHNLMDLIALTRLKCGLVVTAQTYEYMMHSPFELLAVPLERGGVYPNAEPVLGSCGIGVGIESYMSGHRLQENMKDALARIRRKVKVESYVPRGWWVTLDTELEKLNWFEKPKPLRLLKYSPYLQIRYHAKENQLEQNSRSPLKKLYTSRNQKLFQTIKSSVRKLGLAKYFVPYRPYEFYRAGLFKKEIIGTAKSAGLQYMFTKSDFNSYPQTKYIDSDFIALNYTAGQWDGWTPFETINDLTDLRKSEKKLLRADKPGWIVSTIDSCLWTFSGEFWKKGNHLYKIARFCTDGGNSGKLLNVKPFTISRYARVIAEENH